ncbi:hypothetical protein PENCOP_c010G04353 [Penicillium coprophilum]|uniref:Uncharacterized protein n=1 Tax=Penicillium coprophilum TaxID=36646 RepID=A0A1V6UFG0_9EURO|nr:hypothetical protein PENCOP_c010G04353 [Penicillium coprophilum]
MAHMIKTATPPTPPPTIAPRFEDAALGPLDEVLGGGAVIPVAPIAVDLLELAEAFEVVGFTGGIFEPADVSEVTEDAVREGTGVIVDRPVGKMVADSVEVDMEDVVVVLGVTSGNRPMNPAVVNESVDDLVGLVPESSSSPSSGQIPVVHGSLEQHPRKLPAVQTYHCFIPVQVFRSRGTRDPRDSGDSVSNSILKD